MGTIYKRKWFVRDKDGKLVKCESPNWSITYMLNNKQIKESIGPNKKIAELKLKEKEVQIAKGEFIGIKQPKMKLKEFSKIYLQKTSPEKQSAYLERERQALDIHLLPVLGDILLWNVSTEMIKDYIANRTSEPKRPANATINRELACLRALLNCALEWGYIKDSPFSRKQIKLLPEDNERIRYVSDAEKALLFRDLEKNPVLKDIVTIVMHTGLRESEIANLTWSQVDMKERRLIIKKRKGHKELKVPFNDIVYSIISRQTPKIYEDKIFYQMNAKSIGQAFRRSVKRANINDLHFHDLRHHFGIKVSSEYKDIRVTQKLMGHANIQTTMRYAHVLDDDMREAVSLRGVAEGF